MRVSTFLKSFFNSILFIACSSDRQSNYQDWKVYGGTKDNIRYSSAKQIDTSNVNQLQIAWEYHTGDMEPLTQIQVNPIVVDGILYGVSPKLKLFAIDAFNGKEKWSFDPVADTAEVKGSGYFQFNVCRGVTYYSDGDSAKYIFYVASSKLYCINALDGKPVHQFGQHGKIDLHNDLGREVSNLYVSSTSPGIIYKDMIIVGTRVAEEAAAAPGHIRAYDVKTGRLRWIFYTIPQPGEPGYETWDDKEAYKHTGGANSWAGFSMDEKRGILYAPLGSATYDFYGGKRIGQNLFANSLLALDANTGKRIWHYQTVHHDVWDRDLPTAPALVRIKKDGTIIDAVAQPTKTGFIFLFDRVNGQPIYPIEERAVPTTTTLTGEVLSPTQPFPVFPKPFVRQSLTEQDLNNLIPDSSFQDIRSRLATYKTGSIFTSPSKEGTIIFPGFDGGAEWGGPAYDPETGILYVNASEMPWILTMVDVKNTNVSTENNLQAGKRLYTKYCMACHGQDREGSGNNPTLIGTNLKYDEHSFIQLVSSGRRMMPGFAQLSDPEKKALAAFVLELRKRQREDFIPPAEKEDDYFRMPYASAGYKKFLTKEGYPAVKPPWGTLNAINLNTGEMVWKVTLGDYPELKAKGQHTGTENYGGPAVTSGGLVFIAATSDAKMRAFNKSTGQLLWETELPACGFATPAVYTVNGKQFVVIACGGGKLGKASGDSYVAFALPGN